MTSGYTKAQALVGTDWVANNLNAPNIRLVEVDVDTTAYEQGHVPGAVGWNWQKQLQAYPSRDLIAKDQFEKLMGSSGIGNDTTVILYGDNNNWFAAWAYWLLNYYGHINVKLMNGGRKKWADEKRPLISQATSITPKTYQASNPEASIRALRDFVNWVTHVRPGYALVDVRSPREFSGELLAPENLPQEGAQRGGHIPGAANIPWATAVKEDGTFKSAEELRKLYGEKGVTPDKEVIAYCRIGERSAHTWFVLHELLGYPKVRNYDGSWTEWGSMVGVVVER